MEQIGEMAAAVLGIAVAASALRFGWAMGQPLAMWATGKLGVNERMQWQRGTADGRPPVRYVTDGWGRVVFMELDPDAAVGDH